MLFPIVTQSAIKLPDIIVQFLPITTFFPKFTFGIIVVFSPIIGSFPLFSISFGAKSLLAFARFIYGSSHTIAIVPDGTSCSNSLFTKTAAAFVSFRLLIYFELSKKLSSLLVASFRPFNPLEVVRSGIVAMER